MLNQATQTHKATTQAPLTVDRHIMSPAWSEEPMESSGG